MCDPGILTRAQTCAPRVGSVVITHRGPRDVPPRRSVQCPRMGDRAVCRWWACVAVTWLRDVSPVVFPQGQGQGEALSHQPRWPALRAGHLRLLREPGGAGQLLREARTLPEDETALPRDPRAPGALQHGGWLSCLGRGGISHLGLQFTCWSIQQTFIEHVRAPRMALGPTLQSGCGQCPVLSQSRVGETDDTRDEELSEHVSAGRMISAPENNTETGG